MTPTVPGPSYAELAVTSNFSFLHAGSAADELVATAKALGLSAIGIADRNTLAGIVRAHVAAKDHGVRLVVGVRLVLLDGFEVIALPTDKPAYSRLTKLLTEGNFRAPKGECHLTFEDLPILGDGQRFIVMPPYDLDDFFTGQLKRFTSLFPAHTYLALTPYFRTDDRERMQRLSGLARSYGAPLIATNDVLYHIPNRRPLQDVLTCIREHVTIDEAGFRLERNAERHLKSPDEMARLLTGYEDALARPAAILDDISFSLDQLRHDYPSEVAGKSTSPQQELERLTRLGARQRFPKGVPAKVEQMIAHELELIAQLDYAPYFLTVEDIVRFARAQTPPILCQGRGSSANSVVCYCLGITSVNPTEIDLLFERFISADRGEPPDIDVDFEHERREEVIQYIYKKYGRRRAGLAATVIRYRGRSAVNDVGKAMGLSPDIIKALSGMVWGWSSSGPTTEQIREVGLNPQDTRLRQTMKLAQQISGFPRHLSQHVGGFVITDGPLDEVVPVANAAMEDRTTVEWDKDDLDALDILKVDVLSLGMLTCLQKAFNLLADHYQRPMTLAGVPRDDRPTYHMVQQADTVGVFQIESRAQMSMLPRLQPNSFYDLVIEIAIVRPGPIQGDMVNPYLKRRLGLEPVEYPSGELRTVLEKTLGVPLFQEQAMKIAIIGAGFTPSKADKLRKAMASFRNHGTIHNFREDFIKGMIGNGYTTEFAERCFKQIEGFSDYGFPESHSASFSLLAYASAWLKCHYPDVFTCALLNAQPMGFYSSSSIVRDFRGHGGETRPVDINHSDWDNTLETLETPRAATPHENGNRYALRLGLRQIDGMREDAGRQLVAARTRPFTSMRDLYERSKLEIGAMTRLAHADAFRSIGLDRRQALWEIKGLGGYLGKQAKQDELPLFGERRTALSALIDIETRTELPVLGEGEQVHEDYSALHLSLKAHPVSFLRKTLDSRRILRAEQIAGYPDKRHAMVAGLVLVRQRPGTAKGVVFLTLEDETGIANVVVWKKVFDKYRRVVMGARMVAIEGLMQTERYKRLDATRENPQEENLVTHLVARRLYDLSPELMDALMNAQAEPNAAPPVANLWRHPRNTRVLPKGRNFH